MRDQTVDPRVDHYLANSPIITRRLWKYYKRESEVLYPPVDVDRYRNGDDDGYYLHLGRLDGEKGVPAVVEAFAGTDHRLVMAGGRGDVQESVLRTIEDAENIEWRGFVDEDTKLDLLARCRAVVFNGRNEDFGIVSIEANASGKPVLAHKEGFPGVYVEDGENGYLHDGSAAGIRRAIDRLETDGVADPGDGVDRFSRCRFEADLRDGIERRYRAFVATGAPDG
jgi:glycosyltransferase involved in cell wall biosynthesis